MNSIIDDMSIEDIGVLVRFRDTLFKLRLCELMDLQEAKESRPFKAAKRLLREVMELIKQEQEKGN